MSHPSPERRCGAKTRCTSRLVKATGLPAPCPHGADPEHRCLMVKGWGTEHSGTGNCRFHGGGSPNGAKHAQGEVAAAAVAKLGLPKGTGDPFVLLETATRYSQGMLEATAAVLIEVVDKTRTDISLEAAAKLHVDAIRQGAQTGHQAVTADVASRQAKISEQMASVVMAALQNGIGAYAAAIAAGTPAIEAMGLAEAAAADILEVRPAGGLVH